MSHAAVLLSLVLLIALLRCVDDCVHTQVYWRDASQQTQQLNSSNVTTTIPTDLTMCGLSWLSLMQREVGRTAIPANVYWIAAFHTYAPVALAPPSPATSEDVTRALLIVRDSLTRACTNVSGWPGTDDRTVIYDALDTLYLYATLNACLDSTATALAAYYPVTTPDLIIVPGQSTPVNGSVVTLIYSLLTDTYRFRQFTVSSAVIGFTAIPILICIIVCIADRRRRFFARDKRRSSDGKPFLIKSDANDSTYIELDDRSSHASSSTSIRGESL